MAIAVFYKPLRFFPGYSAELIDKTALVELSWEGDVQDSVKNWTALETLLRQKASTLRLSNPLPGIQKTDWPGAFLLETTETHQISHWIISLTIKEHVRKHI